ncbi:MAG: type I methionyl aminopeptidase [Calditrichaeota bacterium]|nr:type I methionyl aminopeptidase [Calditrichota bacterium]MCB9366234.1 type I methionyl aminopeptidase [Calditrichota bacterium]MCB9391697.1 type I methionyl aminopeptidase [Calditrichota bacterium]
MIHIKSDAELRMMRKAGKILASAFEAAEPLMSAGTNADDVDRIVEETIRSQGAIPAFKNHPNADGDRFPYSVCFSINEEVVHGMPRGRKIENGQIIGLDIGVIYEGWYSDSARSYAIGEVGARGQELVRVTRECLDLAIAEAKAGARLSNIGHAVQTHAEKHGFSVIRELVGHGIGKNLWEDPQVPNYGAPGKGPVLRKNMVIAIEPMIAIGGPEVDMIGEWDVLTRDRKPAAHFEHTIVITDGDAEILTKL